MNDRDKSKEQLIAELAELRERLAAAEKRPDGSGASEDYSAPGNPRWHSLVANTPVFILILDRDHRFRFMNRTDAAGSREDVLGRRPYDFYPPQYERIARECVKRVFETGHPQVYEAPVANVDGQMRWYSVHLGPILEGGEIVAVSMIGENITARKQVEQERDRSHAILNAAIDCLPFDFFALGADGRYTLVNAVTRNHYPDTVGKTPEDVCPNERDLDVWLENNRRAFAGQRVEGEVELTVGGERRHYYNIVAPIRDDDELYGILGVNVDITERKRAELALQEAHDELERRVEHRTAELTEANQQLQREVEERRRAQEGLRQSEEKYRTLIEASPDAVVMADLEGRVIFASQQAARLYGFESAEELCGQQTASLVAEEERQRIKANLAKLLEEGVRRGAEYVLLRKDGSRFPAEVSSAVVREADGRAKALIGVFRDVSERKQAQEALQRERRTLLHMLRASDHERQLISYEIHDGLAQQLAAAIMEFESHDHLHKERPHQAKTAYDAGVQMVQRAHFEARRLISGVRPPILDESGIVAAIAHLVYEQSMTGGPKPEFRSAVHVERLAPILTNAIYRVTQEALANALRHSRSDKVRVSLIQEGDRLRLEVQDWGVGFDPKAVPEDHFGLEGIKERTRLLGGQVTIESEAGKGTCIRVVLPILDPE